MIISNFFHFHYHKIIKTNIIHSILIQYTVQISSTSTFSSYKNFYTVFPPLVFNLGSCLHYLGGFTFKYLAINIAVVH